jgi:hypothetical protein
MPKWVTQILAPLACGVLVLFGFIWLNTLVRSHFRTDSRYRIAFADIECEPPAGLSREEFLGEVQYLANWPDEINLLDDGLPARLRLSFTVHPWVESVERVQITPPRQVRVLLRYRTPVLAVVQPDEKSEAWVPSRDGKAKLPGRAVDRGGVLLPLAATDPQLPVLYGNVPPPTGRTGQAWGDAGVAAAASVAHLLAPHQEQLNLKSFEIVDEVLIVSSGRARIVWGPINDDASAESKLQAILDVRAKQGGLDGWEVDVRSPDKPLVRPATRP